MTKIRYEIFGRLDDYRKRISRRSLSKNFKTRKEAEKKLMQLKKDFPTRLKFARVKKIRVPDWMS